MAGRTRADATLMGTRGEGGGGERLGVTKGSERDGAIELESILHIIALSVFSQREVAIAALAACGVACACGRVSICFCALTHFSTLPVCAGAKSMEGAARCRGERVVNHFFGVGGSESLSYASERAREEGLRKTVGKKKQTNKKKHSCSPNFNSKLEKTEKGPLFLHKRGAERLR